MADAVVVTTPATTTTTATTAAPLSTTTTQQVLATAPAAAPATATTATPAPAGAPVNLSTLAPMWAPASTTAAASQEVDTPTQLPAEAVGSIELQANNNPGLDEGTFGKTTEGGMPRETAEILASGLLTQEQIEAAKIENIYKLMVCDGCSAEQTQELALYMQRYVLDGYIRGVDVPGMIQNGNDEIVHFHLGDANAWLSGVADTGGGPNVTLNGFDSASDGWKASLFYHEVSHNLLDRGHNSNDQSIMYGPSGVGNLRSPEQISANYDYMMGELFNPDNWGQVAHPGDKGVKLTTTPEGYQHEGATLAPPPSTSFTPKANVAPSNTGSTPTGSGPYPTASGYPTSTTGQTPRRSAPVFSPIPTMSIDDNGEITVPQQMYGEMGGAGAPTTGYPTPAYSGTNGSGSGYKGYGGSAASAPESPASQIGPANEFEAALDEVLQQASPMLGGLGGALASMAPKDS